ncbi:MAG: putative transcriptional regulator [Chlamydiia bacterium]|nr:putative transcriptional regulator [Chlamydiia bacterium]
MDESHIRKKTSVQSEFGKRVKCKRKELRLTQEELAERAGLDPTYIGSIERGERNVSLGNILALAQALMLSPKDLIPEVPVSKRDQARIEFGKRLVIQRQETGYTQESLAEKTGLDLRYISSLEKGEREAGFQDIIALAQALQVSPKELMPDS